MELYGNIVTPSDAFYGRIEWNGSIITAIERKEDMKQDEPWILAGFVDIHFHGLGPFSAEILSDIPGLAQFAVSVGTTAICPTLSSATRDMMVDFTAGIHDLMKTCKDGATILGSHLEGPWLNPVFKGGMRADRLRQATIEEADAFLNAAKGSLKLMTIAPEMPGAADVIRHLAEHGVTMSSGHSACPDWYYEDAVASGITQFCHLFDAYPCPVSDSGIRQPCVTDLAIIDDRVMKEIIMDGLHVPPALISLVRRAANPDTIIAITDAMQGAGLKEGRFLDAGRWYVVREGELARTEEDNTIVGSSLSMNLAFKNMTERFGFSPVNASKALSANPAKAVHVTRKGRLEVGLDADITVLEPDSKTVRACFVEGIRRK